MYCGRSKFVIMSLLDMGIAVNVVSFFELILYLYPYVL